METGEGPVADTKNEVDECKPEIRSLFLLVPLLRIFVLRVGDLAVPPVSTGLSAFLLANHPTTKRPAKLRQ